MYRRSDGTTVDAIAIPCGPSPHRKQCGDWSTAATSPGERPGSLSRGWRTRKTSCTLTPKRPRYSSLHPTRPQGYPQGWDGHGMPDQEADSAPAVLQSQGFLPIQPQWGPVHVQQHPLPHPQGPAGFWLCFKAVVPSPSRKQAYKWIWQPKNGGGGGGYGNGVGFCRGMLIGPCTTHPHMLLIPRDSGVNPLPLYTSRRHRHLPRVVGVVPRVHGLHYGFLPSLQRERVLPIRLNEKEKQKWCGNHLPSPPNQ